MADATTIKGGKVVVKLGNSATPIVYTAPCGFNQRSIALNKGLEDARIPDCDNPDFIQWLGRDAVSLSMSVSGEGLLATESIETWLSAVESADSTPVKVDFILPAKTITYTGKMHVESFEIGAEKRQARYHQRVAAKRRQDGADLGMSRDAQISFPWADGGYTFRLGWGELEMLQEATGVGPYKLHDRLCDRSWVIGDIAEVIRCGLIGGGLKPVEAFEKVNRYVRQRPPLENLTFAQAILTAGLMGAPEEGMPGRATRQAKRPVLDDLPNGRIRFAAIYGTGAAMGFGPQAVRAMSIFQFQAAVDGYLTAHCPEDTASLSDKERDELWDLIDAG